MQFEELLSEISRRLANLNFEKVDEEIEDAQHVMCEGLELDRCALFQRCHLPPESLLLTHVYPCAELRQAKGEADIPGLSVAALRASRMRVEEEYEPARCPGEFDLKSMFPWIYRQLIDHEVVVIPDVDGLPPDAAIDQRRLQDYGTKSELMLPLRVAGHLRGCLEVATTRGHTAWNDSDIKRLRVLANVFINALALNSAERALEKSETRLLLVESAGVGFWTIGANDNHVSLTSTTRELCRLSPGKELDRESFWRLIHQDDRERVELAAQRAIEMGENLMEECRLAPEDGSVKWISLRGSRLCGATGKADCLTGTMALIQGSSQELLTEQSLTSSCSAVKQLNEVSKAESAYLKNEMRTHTPHGKIIGHSASIRRVLYQVEQVASADCAVLISGETGTGKELIAQEIHRMSKRGGRLMVLVNCAALPSALVESELFGRERGAYTGALTTQIGHFETADGSSLFLDEVGELSMEVQAKLLRVLQHGEVQRLGNPKTHKVDVRVIAATNRDLVEEVRKGRFREDLLYRLKVFPIEIPPLRERREDIAQMVCVFLEEFSTRMGKKITKVPRQVIERLENHDWPGNIRELRNVIEHSVILSSGEILKLSKLGDAPTREIRALTLAEAEREHIVKALESTSWRIKGPYGAARRLDLEPSTLYSRMQKLGIPNRRQRDEMSSEQSVGKLVMKK